MSDGPEIFAPTDEELFQSLEDGRDDAAARLFHANGAARPRVLWSPRALDLCDPRHRAYLQHCQDVAPASGLPLREGFVEALPEPLAASLILIGLGADGALTYDYFGDAVAEQYGKRLSGPMAGQMAEHIERFYRAVFSVAAKRRGAVLTMHEPPDHIFVQSWHRLVMPLIDAGGAVCGFGVLNVAVNPLRFGLDAVHEAVFVLDAGHRVLYANPPARLLMPCGDGRMRGGDFFDETGIALPDALPAAEDLLDRGTVEARRSLVLRDTLLADAVVTVSAVMYRQWPCCVVIVRAEG